MSTDVQASSSSYGLTVTTLVCSLQQSVPASQQLNIEHDIWAATQPHLPVEHGWLSIYTWSVAECDGCRRHIRWKCGWIQRCTIFAFLPSILDRVQVWRVWPGGRFPYYDLMLSVMYMLNKGIMRWRQWLQFRSRGKLCVGHFGHPQLIMVSVHITLNFGTITGSSEGSCLRYQIVFICSQLTEYV